MHAICQTSKSADAWCVIFSSLVTVSLLVSRSVGVSFSQSVGLSAGWSVGPSISSLFFGVLRATSAVYSKQGFILCIFFLGALTIFRAFVA